MAGQDGHAGRMNARSSVVLAERDTGLPALAGVFGLLADPGRLRILLLLRSGEANVGQLSAHSGLSESATSHALRLLRSHRVVRVRRSGRQAFYSLDDQHVQDLLDIAVAHAGEAS
jgi:ArsR family transcriptional regulator, lead/cadmium/zinc/bismuth-responsive transcriptional repressor